MKSQKKNQQITLSQAIAGFMLNIEGRRLSVNTINDYKNTLRKFQIHFKENPLMDQITTDDISAWLAVQTVSKKTVLNYHTCLSSLWKWLVQQKLLQENIIHDIERPRPEKRLVIPLDPDEIRSLMASLDKSKPYSRPGKRTSDHSLPNVDRNRAVLLFFLDNGVRVSELCGIKIKHLDVKNARCFIFGKGSKERFVPFSARTGQVIWRYLTLRKDHDPDDYLFVNRDNRQMTRNGIAEMLADLGARAGVEDVHPHRLRHTFAINFLRAGGDIFTLQMILGHEELDMVRHYSRLANADMARVHRRASPVEFLRL